MTCAPIARSNSPTTSMSTDVAPVLDFPGALGRVKGSLAPLAAVAPLTRPARSRVAGNYRSDVRGDGLVAEPPDRVSKWSDVSSAWER